MTAEELALEELGDLLGVLGHADRLRLLQELRGGPRDVASLVEAVGLSQSRTSQHLGLLRAHRVVESSRHGRRVRYRLRDPDLARWLLSGLDYLAVGRGAALEESISAVRERYTD